MAKDLAEGWNLLSIALHSSIDWNKGYIQGFNFSVNSLLEAALDQVPSLACNISLLTMGALHQLPFYQEESQKVFIRLPRTIET